jgi:hypothetical protein
MQGLPLLWPPKSKPKRADITKHVCPYFGDMKFLPLSSCSSSGLLTRTLLFGILIGLAACTPQVTPTLFVPPTAAALLPTALVLSTSRPSISTATIVPTMTAPAISPTPCTNNLSFVQDVTIPDGTTVSQGTTVDKQWLITNTGSCNWDASYRLKLIAGDAMGAPTELALYPARAGTQAILRIVFTAPANLGAYESAWQAFAPDGTAFGDAVYIQFSVSQ